MVPVVPGDAPSTFRAVRFLLPMEDPLSSDIAFLKWLRGHRKIGRAEFALRLSAAWLKAAFRREPVVARAAQVEERLSFEPGRQSVMKTAAAREDPLIGNLLPKPIWRGDEAVKALRIIRDYNPDASLAAEIAKRTLTSTYRIKAMRVGAGGATDEVDEENSRRLTDFAATCMSQFEGGGLHAMVNVGIESCLTDGAVAGELNVAPSLKDVLDVVLLDPTISRFEKVDGEIIPVYVQRGQVSGDPFNLNQFRYVGLDATVRDPHGRPWFLPALDTTVPQHELRNILQKIVKAFVFGRPIYKADWDRIAPNIPDRVKSVADLRTWMEEILAGVKSSIEAGGPDDSLVTWNFVDNGWVGPAGTGSPIRVAEAAAVYDTDQGSAVKTPLSLLGRSVGAALSTNTDVHYVNYVRRVEAIRATVVTLLEWLFTQVLRIWGVNCIAEIEYDQVSTEDQLASAQARLANHQAAAIAIEQNIASREVVATELGYPTPVSDETPATAPAPAASREEPVEGESWDAWLDQLEEAAFAALDRGDEFTPVDAEAEGRLQLSNWRRLAPRRPSDRCAGGTPTPSERRRSSWAYSTPW